MKRWSFSEFGLDRLELVDVADPQRPGLGEIVLDVRALSLNFRDLLVARGHYLPKLDFPAVPLSDASGVVSDVGPDVDLEVGTRVASHFIADWVSGPVRAEYRKSTLGQPGPGVASERVVLPAHAVVPIPDEMPFDAAATLPIAGLTAWSALVTEGVLARGQSALTLGTGGVSIFALQIAKAMGARAFITSSSNEKLARARALGADGVVNYVETPEWQNAILELTGGAGVDVTVETGGAGTLDRSIKATKVGGTIAMIGVLSGGRAEVSTVDLMMRRQRLQGILVDSREHFQEFVDFVAARQIAPVIHERYPFDSLDRAMKDLEKGEHFGKLVVVRA